MARTILVADDSVTIRKVVELTFSDTDIRVEVAGTGHEALRRLDDVRPDLVLADVVMPGPSGYEICRRVKGSERPVPVLLLAGTFEPYDEEEARACGADGCLVKPFESSRLVDRVEALLARPVPASPTPLSPDEQDLEAVLEDLAATAEAESAGRTHDAPAALGLPAEASSEGSSEEFGAAPPWGAEVPEEGGAAEGADLGSAIAPSSGDSPAEGLRLTPQELDAIARAVVERLGDRVLREIAWEVVPDLAEIVIRERIRELERE